MRFIAFIETAPPGQRRNNWSAFFPDVPGCAATGETFEAAAKAAREALAVHLAGIAEDGDDLPEPRSMADILAAPDLKGSLMQNGGTCVPQIVSVSPPHAKRVRINITIDEHLLGMVDDRAKSDGVTRSGLIEDALQAVLEG